MKDLDTARDAVLAALRRAYVWATPVAPTRIEVADATPGLPPRASSIRIIRFVAADDARLMVAWSCDGAVIGAADEADAVARAIKNVVAS